MEVVAGSAGEIGQVICDLFKQNGYITAGVD